MRKYLILRFFVAFVCLPWLNDYEFKAKFFLIRLFLLNWNVVIILHHSLPWWWIRYSINEKKIIFRNLWQKAEHLNSSTHILCQRTATTKPIWVNIRFARCTKNRVLCKKPMFESNGSFQIVHKGLLSKLC